MLCECGSDLDATYNTTTNGFDCESCRKTIVVCECGMAYYDDGDGCSCGRRAFDINSDGCDTCRFGPESCGACKDAKLVAWKSKGGAHVYGTGELTSWDKTGKRG